MNEFYPPCVGGKAHGRHVFCLSQYLDVPVLGKNGIEWQRYTRTSIDLGQDKPAVVYLCQGHTVEDALQFFVQEAGKIIIQDE